MVKHTRHGLSLFISVRVTGYPRISSLNHGKNVEFEIVLREDYPFSPPEICCNTEFTVPRLNDRRNLLPHLVQKWGPAIMLVDLISRLPDFLNVLQSNLNKQLTLHELGQYGSTYWIDEFEQSSADIYKCTQITGRMVAPKIESLLVLTDSMLLVLTGKGKRLAQNQPLRLQHFSYLDEIVKIDEVTPKRYKFSFTNSKDITLDFEATQTKSMVMSLRNRMGLWKAEEEQTGSLTGCTALELQLKIEQMNGAPTNEVGTLRRRIDCLSDAIEMFSVKDTERCERYKTQLKRLLADPTTQATLFQGERLPHRKS